MKFSTKFVLFDQVFERLIQFLAIKLINLQKKGFHFFLIELLNAVLPKDGQKFHPGNSVKCIDRVFP